MNKPSRIILRSNVCLMLILVIILIGFSTILIRQNNLRSYEHRVKQQIQNVTAKKDLGELIVSDLRKVSTQFYMILNSANTEQQKILLSESQKTARVLHTILNILADGGTITRGKALNLTNKYSVTTSISYTPSQRHLYNVAVLTLRPQLLLLEEKIAQTIALTAKRNRILKNRQGESLKKEIILLRIFAKGIRAQILRLTENANKLAYDANDELNHFRAQITATQKNNQHTETLWALSIIFSVFALISLIYRQVLSTQNKLSHAVQKLQRTEEELQDTNIEVLTLNKALNNKVIVTTEMLQTAEKQWADAFDAISSPIFLHDKKGRIIKANQAYLDRAGHTFAQVLNQYYWEIFPKLEAPLPDCLESSQSKHNENCTEEIDIIQGSDIYRSQTFVINDVQGNYLNSMHLMEDVTNERKTHKALIESEKRFRDITNSMDEVLILLDRDLKVQLMNTAAINTYGVDANNYRGQPCHKVVWGCNDICDNCPTLEVIRTEEVSHAMRYMPDGRILARSIYPIKNNIGDITAYAVIAADVTAREKYIANLQRYEQILSTNTDLIAFFDQNHICLLINDVMTDYYATTAEKLIGKHATEIMGEKHYQTYLTHQQTIFNDQKPVTFKTWIDFPGHGLCNMKITLTPYVNDNKVGGVVARLKNITAQTEQEAKLRLMAMVFKSTSEGITITAEDGTIELVNPAFCQITGYSEAEAIGQNPSILKSGRHDEAFYQQMWQALARNGSWQGEIWNKRKNGDIYPEWLSINTLHDEHDNISHYIATFSDLTKINSVVQKLEHQAHHHALTGLPNRLLLRARLDHSIQQAARNRQQGAVFHIDLDNLKHINDSLGHAAGDEVLLQMSQRLQKHCRNVDTVAHLSGDEFIVVLDTVRSVHNAVARAEHLLQQLSQPLMIRDYELVITSSIGVAIFPDDGEDIDMLLKNSDVAMHKAKDSGKNSYHLYSPELTVSAFERIMLENNLRRAVEKEEFILHYQPQVGLPHGEIIACEALVRWQHHNMGLIPPDKFIPLSEETGLIIPMGEWILRTACQQWVDWRAQGFALGKMAVNLSGRQIQQKDLLQVVQRVLHETGCPGTALELEITESFMMQQPEEAIKVLQQLRDLGIELSIDDFGTGHSSLSYLKRFPVQRLKIDRSFIRDMEHNADGFSIVKTIIAMGHSLNLKITAEGIETEEQQRSLADLHCDEAQGYLFSRPVPADEFAQLFQLSTT